MSTNSKIMWRIWSQLPGQPITGNYIGRLYVDNQAIVMKILGRRRRLEKKLKIAPFSKSTADLYVRYIDNEKALLDVVKEIKEENENFIPIIYEIEAINKAHCKYQDLIKSFSHEMKYWYSYMDFASKHSQGKMYETIENLLIKFAEQNQYRPEFWKMAATWFADYKKQPDEANKLLMRGFQYNKKSLMLYSEAFHLELKRYALDPVKLEEGVEVPYFAHALDILEAGLGGCQNEDEKLNFVINLLNITEYYRKSWCLQNVIVTLMKSEFSSKEEFWHKLALKELEGKNYEDGNSTEKTVEEKAAACIMIYETATEKLQSQKMWTFYLDTIHSASGFTDEMKLSALKKAHQAGNKLNQVFLGERHYISFETLSPENRDELLLDATAKLPNSIELWRMRLGSYIMQDDEDALEKVFNEGIVVLKGRSIPLWTLRIQVLSLPPATPKKVFKINNLYEEAYLKHPEISDVMIGRYLEWSVKARGCTATRQSYLHLISLKQSLAIHLKMFELERLFPDGKDVLRKIIRDACQYFGKTSWEIWLYLVRYTKEYDAANLESVYDEAVETLVSSEDKRLFKIDFYSLKHGRNV